MDHINTLRQHPEMMERLAAILRICDSPEGKIKRADEIEELLIDEIRMLGNATMEQWAKAAETRAGTDHQKNHPGSYCGKKNA